MPARPGSAQGRINEVERTFGVSGVIKMLARRAEERRDACIAQGTDDGLAEWALAKAKLERFAKVIARILQEDK
jgi:hypothetical protein